MLGQYRKQRAVRHGPDNDADQSQSGVVFTSVSRAHNLPECSGITNRSSFLELASFPEFGVVCWSVIYKYLYRN